MASARYSPPVSTTASLSAAPTAGSSSSSSSPSAAAPAAGVAPRPFALSSSFSTTAGTGASQSTNAKMRASVDALSWRQNASPHHHLAAAQPNTAAANKRASSPGRTVSSSGATLRPASEYLGAGAGYGTGHGAPHERGHSFGGTTASQTATTSASESESRSARSRSVCAGSRIQVTDSCAYLEPSPVRAAEGESHSPEFGSPPLLTARSLALVSFLGSQRSIAGSKTCSTTSRLSKRWPPPRSTQTSKTSCPRSSSGSAF